MKRYCVILPYFGNVPSWWSFFLAGVKSNPEITFIVISDCIKVASGIDNLAVIQATLLDIRKRAEQSLETKVSLTTPLKLCDLRPMYGTIFEKEIREYDYWGYGDIDLVYGNLKKYLTQVPEAADIISFRKGWISGSLAFIKNTRDTCFLFKEAENWESVLSSPQCQLFDELGGLGYRERMMGVPFEHLKGCQDSFSAVVDRAIYKKPLCLFENDTAKELLCFGDALKWTVNGLFDTRTGTEWAYYHMVINKRRYFACHDRQMPISSFYVTPTGFYNEDEYLTGRSRIIAGSRIVIGFAKGVLRFIKRFLGRCKF